jgi:hypothetical protein
VASRFYCFCTTDRLFWIRLVDRRFCSSSRPSCSTSSKLQQRYAQRELASRKARETRLRGLQTGDHAQAHSSTASVQQTDSSGFDSSIVVSAHRRDPLARPRPARMMERKTSAKLQQRYAQRELASRKARETRLRGLQSSGFDSSIVVSAHRRDPLARPRPARRRRRSRSHVMRTHHRAPFFHSKPCSAIHHAHRIPRPHHAAVQAIVVSAHRRDPLARPRPARRRRRSRSHVNRIPGREAVEARLGRRA